MSMKNILTECMDRKVILTLINEVTGRDGLKYGAVFGTVDAVLDQHVQIGGTMFIEIDTIFSVEVTDHCLEFGLEMGWDEQQGEHRYFSVAPIVYDVETPVLSGECNDASE